MTTIRATLRHARAMPRALAWERERARECRIHRISAGRLDAPLAEKLHEFEQRFVLRLSDGTEYVRVHGDDVVSHYRTIGRPAVTFIAEEHGRVVGTKSLVVKRVRVPGRGVLRFVYALNVRVAPECRFGAVLSRMQLAAFRWALPRCWGVLTVIPTATATPPRSRSGRFGIPSLRPLAHIPLLRIPLDCACDGAHADRCLTTEPHVQALYRRLTRDRIAPVGGWPARRSTFEPLWLALPDGSACCCLEGPSRFRRWVAPSGPDLVWRYPSFFAASSVDAAERMLRVAAAHARRIGPEQLKSLFDPQMAAALTTRLALPREPSPLTIYGSTWRGTIPDLPWTFHDAEL